MKRTPKTAKKSLKTKKPKAYLTKRILVSAAKTGVQEAAIRAMDIMGHVVVAQDGWVVKRFADGTIQRIEEIPTSNSQVILD